MAASASAPWLSPSVKHLQNRCTVDGTLLSIKREDLECRVCKDNDPGCTMMSRYPGPEGPALVSPWKGVSTDR
jgi:hypothetical protein